MAKIHFFNPFCKHVSTFGTLERHSKLSLSRRIRDRLIRSSAREDYRYRRQFERKKSKTSRSNDAERDLQAPSWATYQTD